MVFLYLAVIVAANLAVTKLGPSILPFTAFILIPFDLVTRDALHNRWNGKSFFFIKMTALILSGSILSAILNADSKPIALASFTAFGCAGIIDSVIYGLLSSKSFTIKVNTSNLFSSITDSLIFPFIAFGIFDPELSLMQSSAKFFGGVVWAIVIKDFIKEELNGSR